MKKEKLLAKLLNDPKDYRLEELSALLAVWGYYEASTSKTGGSRRKFFCPDRQPLYFHKPHPKGILKGYQIKKVVETLKTEGLI